MPLAEGVAWFKACVPVQAFEPRLTAKLFARYPDRVAEVLAYDEERLGTLCRRARPGHLQGALRPRFNSVHGTRWLSLEGHGLG